MIGGIIGASVHALTSVIDYIGNGKLTVSWVPFYVVRPFIGLLLALVLYFAIRGGFLTASSGTEVSPYGAVTLAAFAGMFSKQATDKLQEVFETMFRTQEGEGDAKRHDPLDTNAGQGGGQ